MEKYRQQPLILDQEMDVTAELKQRDPQIIDMSPIRLQGTISLEGQFIFGDFRLTAQMDYPSTRSLQVVHLPLDLSVHETYTTLPEDQWQPEDKERYGLIIPLEDQTLDLQSVVEDNLLLGIPTQVLTPQEQSEGTMPEGQEWSVISEEDYEKQSATNLEAQSELAKLKQLFPDANAKD
ncbi:YceD family protein [Bombilactobacillus folatiphilus]|uniref:YceD family protein n=1 Tax=Bombilactobacillus folatiphilus TaxID=2923362 RepID=A0ABY4P9X5_9LACO|nr:YceD family protein [Bombilactobacillus folatiphilus]UQS82548.1 YceD family protein [Bombilactobacillus folatiphilus]